MGSVSSSLNPGVADLLQTLSSVNSPTLNSPAVVSALEAAPPADIVELSTEATQLQNIDTLFGIGATPTSSTDSILQALENEGANASPTSQTPADQTANAQAAIQAELTQGLFGTGTNNSLPGTLFNTLG
jgi:hypothetical protein